jgi:hypothetical protein
MKLKSYHNLKSKFHTHPFLIHSNKEDERRMFVILVCIITVIILAN